LNFAPSSYPTVQTRRAPPAAAETTQTDKILNVPWGSYFFKVCVIFHARAKANCDGDEQRPENTE